jgi:hypothetical protein
MEKSTKILIGVGVVGVLGLLIYNKSKAATPAIKSGGAGKKPNNPIVDHQQPDNPIIDPTNGKLVPPKNTPKKPNPSTIDTTDPNANPQFDMSKGIGSGGGGSIPSGGKGGGVLTNDPDLSSGRMKKYDPNAKDENWIKALNKRQKAGNQKPNKKGQKQAPKVDCSSNPYDPTCQKVKDCYYNPYDPSCLQGTYDYKNDYNNDYNNDYYYYNNNPYQYPDQLYDYTPPSGYNYNPPAYYNYSNPSYNYSYSNPSYNNYPSYNYSYSYTDMGGSFGGGGGNARGGSGNPSDFNHLNYGY